MILEKVCFRQDNIIVLISPLSWVFYLWGSELLYLGKCSLKFKMNTEHQALCTASFLWWRGGGKLGEWNRKTRIKLILDVSVRSEKFPWTPVELTRSRTPWDAMSSIIVARNLSGIITPVHLCHQYIIPYLQSNWLKMLGWCIVFKMKVIYFSGTRPNEEMIINPPTYLMHTTHSEHQMLLLVMAELLQMGKFHIFLDSYVCNLFLAGSIFKSRLIYGCNWNAYRYIYLNKLLF